MGHFKQASLKMKTKFIVCKFITKIIKRSQFKTLTVKVRIVEAEIEADNQTKTKVINLIFFVIKFSISDKTKTHKRASFVDLKDTHTNTKGFNSISYTI